MSHSDRFIWQVMPLACIVCFNESISDMNGRPQWSNNFPHHMRNTYPILVPRPSQHSPARSPNLFLQSDTLMQEERHPRDTSNDQFHMLMMIKICNMCCAHSLYVMMPFWHLWCPETLNIVPDTLFAHGLFLTRDCNTCHEILSTYMEWWQPTPRIREMRLHGMMIMPLHAESQHTWNEISSFIPGNTNREHQQTHKLKIFANQTTKWASYIHLITSQITKQTPHSPHWNPKPQQYCVYSIC